MICCAVTGPMPGSASSCSSVAELRLHLPARTRQRPPPAAGAAARLAAQRNEHLLAVGDRGGQVDELERSLRLRAARLGDRVVDPAAVGEP